MAKGDERGLDEAMSSAKYFWQEKGDVARCVFWPTDREILAEERPEIIAAWDNYKAAELILDALLGATPTNDASPDSGKENA